MRVPSPPRETNRRRDGDDLSDDGAMAQRARATLAPTNQLRPGAGSK